MVSIHPSLKAHFRMVVNPSGKTICLKPTMKNESDASSLTGYPSSSVGTISGSSSFTSYRPQISEAIPYWFQALAFQQAHPVIIAYPSGCSFQSQTPVFCMSLFSIAQTFIQWIKQNAVVIKNRPKSRLFPLILISSQSNNLLLQCLSKSVPAEFLNRCGADSS